MTERERGPQAGDADPTAVEVRIEPDLDALFRANYSRMVRTLTVVAGSREAAADAVQEAFVKAHLRRRTLRDYDDPVGWIRRVAINRLRDDHRRAGRKRRAVERERARARENVVDAPQAADEELTAAMAELPKQQRVAMALFYVEDLSVADVAAAMGLSQGAVKYHLHEGRERMRRRLEGGGR